MTYKKADFYSSPTMRQFSKIASDKGWLKSEKPIEKKASITSEPVGFVENAISLTAELRKQNNVVLNKLAEEIEYNLMQYKVASVYGVFNETGEDLVDQAHPDGSHKMEGMIGDAVIETVVDQQKKIHEVVFKKPKGKLANRELIELVKQASIIFDTKEEKEMKAEVSELFKKYVEIPINGIVNNMIKWVDDGKLSMNDKSLGYGDLIKTRINIFKDEIISSSKMSSYSSNIIKQLNNVKNELNTHVQKYIIKADNGLIKNTFPGWSQEIITIINSFNKNVINRLIEKAGQQTEEGERISKELKVYESPNDLKNNILNKIKLMQQSIEEYRQEVRRLQELEAGSGKYKIQIDWIEKTAIPKLNSGITLFKAASEELMSEKEVSISGIQIVNGKSIDSAFATYAKTISAIAKSKELVE